MEMGRLIRNLELGWYTDRVNAKIHEWKGGCKW